MRQRTRGGSISMMMLMAMAITLTMVLGTTMYVGQSMKRADRDARAYRAFQAAQAGMDYQIGLSYEELVQHNGQLQPAENDLDDVLADIAPNTTGDSRVIVTADPRRGWVTATATFNGMTRSVRTYIESRNVSIWNNAIFAGAGAAGRAINGNVDIRGSMHLLGDGEPYSDVNGNGRWDARENFTDSNNNGIWDPGEPFTDANGDGVCNPAEPFNDLNANGFYDPPLTLTDLNSTFSGNAHVGNHYSGMPLELEALVPAAPRVTGIEQLGTEVRVKHGQISISGSATMGSSGLIDGGTSKATLDGVYVNDGFVGSQGANAVFSDNGTSNSYDLGHLGIDFPVLSGIGAQEYRDTSGTNWNTQEVFLENRTLTVPITSITPSTAAFSYGPDAYGNSIRFTPQVTVGNGNNAVTTPATLEVNGIVRFANSLTIGDSGAGIRYIGSGTLYSRQDINIRCDLLPRADRTFPTTARIGLIAMRNMNLATGSGDAQIKMAGAFYAQGTIVSRKQNQIAGTFVGNYYDMGTNVPNIYQVPSLVYNMPPGMPGDKNYFTLKTKSWRDRR